MTARWIMSALLRMVVTAEWQAVPSLVASALVQAFSKTPTLELTRHASMVLRPPRRTSSIRITEHSTAVRHPTFTSLTTWVQAIVASRGHFLETSSLRTLKGSSTLKTLMMVSGLRRSIRALS